MNYTRFLTNVSQNRKPSMIRELTNLLTNASPELVFLAGGLPNPKSFPFEQAKIQLKDGQSIDIDAELMNQCLQYGPTSGYPPLVNQLKEFTKKLHNPPNWQNSDLCVTTGSQDALCKAIEMMVLENDYFVIQEPCYTGTLSILNPYKPRYVAIESDDKGMIPSSLKSMLSQWDPMEIRNLEKGVPKVIYINPTAANPTGVSVPNERRREIYKIAQEYNLIILEDDPYYFVQFETRENFPQSFLNIDTDGRVLRFDSFSKVLSSGIRIGYVTGAKELITRINLHKQVSDLHTSSLAQVMVSELLKKWGDSGFFKHTESIKELYLSQRNAMLASADKHLTGLCEWAVPTGGMFLWLKAKSIPDTWEMITKKGLEKNVILIPGHAFMTDDTKPCQYMRASFSITSPDKMEKGIQSLAQLIREEML